MYMAVWNESFSSQLCFLEGLLGPTPTLRPPALDKQAENQSTNINNTWGSTKEHICKSVQTYVFSVCLISGSSARGA